MAPTMAYIEAPNVNGQPITATLDTFRRTRQPDTGWRECLKRRRLASTKARLTPAELLREEMS